MIYITGLITGIIMGKSYFGFSFEVAMIYWIASFAVGSLFIGITGISGKRYNYSPTS